MLSPLAQFVWETRYRLHAPPAQERSVEETWNRVARAVASVEKDPLHWSEQFSSILQGFRFLPGGRILAGAGSGRAVTLCNCFVMGDIEDSNHGIFQALKEGAATLQQGGGVGYDFSTLTPRGCRERGTGAVASGPISFMHVWDAACAAFTASDVRPGAMMATLRCDHPDIEQFVEAKLKPGVLEHFNLSVQVTHAFMRAVRNDAGWPLVFPEHHLGEMSGERIEQLQREWTGSDDILPCRVLRTISARQLWDKLCRDAQLSGEPGILFIDRINAQNNLGYRETLSATNPCGEVPLPPYGACTLGSINLVAFTRHPFTAMAALDLEAIRRSVSVAVRFLDDVIDVTDFPLVQQRDETRATRRIGLGITGLADALAMLGLHYGSNAAREAARDMMRAIRDAAYGASVELARIKGAFPAFDRDRFLERPFIRSLPRELHDAIAEHGIRNGHLLAIAPTGSISLLAGNVSTGIDPIFRLQGERRLRESEGSYRNFEAIDYAYALWRDTNTSASPPGYFMEMDAVSPVQQLLMHASLQPLVDAAISKTFALPANASAVEVARLYRAADALGLKGCTVYRIRSSSRSTCQAGCSDVASPKF